MRQLRLAVCAATLFLCILGRTAIAAPPPNSCDFPSGLGGEISKKYPGTHLLNLADLPEYHRNLYQKDHGTRCPGLVRVNFYGDNNPAWALILSTGEAGGWKVELLVARHVGTDWEIRSLDKTTGTPVVWRQPPGKYVDVYGQKSIAAKNPVIVFCGYGSWAVLYSWSGIKVRKIWLSD